MEKVQVIGVLDTKNPDIKMVNFKRVLTALAEAAGKKAIRAMHPIPAEAAKNFAVGQVWTATKLEMVVTEEPQYEGHEPFEKDGKYYSAKITL